MNGQADMALADVVGDGQALVGRVLRQNWLAVQRQAVNLSRQPDIMPVGQLALEPAAVDTRRKQRDVLVVIARAAGRLGQRLQKAELGEPGVIACSSTASVFDEP